MGAVAVIRRRLLITAYQSFETDHFKVKQQPGARGDHQDRGETPDASPAGGADRPAAADLTADRDDQQQPHQPRIDRREGPRGNPADQPGGGIDEDEQRRGRRDPPRRGPTHQVQNGGPKRCRRRSPPAPRVARSRRPSWRPLRCQKH